MDSFQMGRQNREQPSGWRYVEIGEVAHLVTNGFVGTATPYHTDGTTGVYYVQGFNVRANRIDLSNAVRVTGEFHVQQQKSQLQEGDMLTVQSGHIGTTAVVPSGFVDANCHALIITRFQREHVEPHFVAYFLNSSQGKRVLRRLEVGSSVQHINTKDLKRLIIPLPPLPEQRKIAEILGTWDAAIGRVEQLIAALQRRKQGLMQRLLTGTVRFPEFGGTEARQQTRYTSLPAEWDYVAIGEIAREVSLRNTDGDNLSVLSCTKYDGLVDSLSYFGRQIFSEDTSSYKVVMRGQFAYATNHIEEGSIGYQDLYDAALISPMYTVFETTDRVNDAFLYRLLKTELYRHIFEVNTSGTVNRRGRLGWDDFARIRVPLPSEAEQRKIAEFFATVDKEIALQQQRLAQLQAQKKGLMQRLLTGQVRVKVDSITPAA